MNKERQTKKVKRCKTRMKREREREKSKPWQARGFLGYDTAPNL